VDAEPPPDGEKNTAPLRRLPAEHKLCSALVFSLAVAMLSSPLPALGACVFALCLLACSGLAIALIAGRLLPVNLFLAPMWVLLPLSFNAEAGAALSLGSLGLGMSGLHLALLVTLKANAITAALLALAGASGLPENAHALHRLGVPKKFVVLLLITHSNIERMAEEYRRGFQAAKLRGFSPATSLRSYGVYAGLVGFLFVRSWQRAQRVDAAMRLRGFCGRFPLIVPHGRKKTGAAPALTGLCCAVSLALLIWNRYV
jgi:cobalt/nickel transport system permease protein